MSEEENFNRSVEELKIDEKNKGVASETLQLFLVRTLFFSFVYYSIQMYYSSIYYKTTSFQKLANMLGYSCALAFFLVCFILILSYPLVADDFYPNNSFSASVCHSRPKGGPCHEISFRLHSHT